MNWKYDPKYGFIDMTIQSVFIIPILYYIYCSFSQGIGYSVIELLTLKLILGIYQVMNGVVGVMKKRKFRKRYLLIVLIYFLHSNIFYTIELTSQTDLFLQLIVENIAIIIGFGYFLLTAIEFIKEPFYPSHNILNREILDDELFS